MKTREYVRRHRSGIEIKHQPSTQTARMATAKEQKIRHFISTLINAHTRSWNARFKMADDQPLSIDQEEFSRLQVITVFRSVVFF